MLVGYCRVSTTDQSTNLQFDALKKAGCEQIFQDVASGVKDDREGLRQALEFVRDGDVLLVFKLDRLGRSLNHLVTTINRLTARGVGFRSLTENIDSTTAGGRLFLHIFGSLAEFERSLIVERTRFGLEAARARGRVGGRPRALTAKQEEILHALLKDRSTTIGSICETLKISRATLYRYHSRPKTRPHHNPSKDLGISHDDGHS